MAVYLITGASSGIGLELSKQAVAAGHTVYGAARRNDVLEKLRNDLGPSFIPVILDVTDREAVRAACASLPALPDVVILNAGVGENESRKKFDASVHERTFGVNYFGAIYVIDALLPSFIERGSGKFVAISSLAAYRGLPLGGAYGASKAALSIAIESMRVTYGWTGVRFVTVHPGFVDTPIQKGGRPPFMMPVSKAAKKILSGIDRDCLDITFPLIIHLSMIVLIHTPNWLYARIMGKNSPMKHGEG